MFVFSCGVLAAREANVAPPRVEDALLVGAQQRWHLFAKVSVSFEVEQALRAARIGERARQVVRALGDMHLDGETRPGRAQ